jgi:Gti1/Pac2 family transcription factor
MDTPTGRRSSHVASDVQHFIGYVETTTDALRLIMAARQGIIPRITRRLNDSERRSMIRSGAVFVFCVEESGIKRWTEGLSWSPSRIVGNFLVRRCFPFASMVTPHRAATAQMYREVGERNSNRGTDTALLPPGTSTFRVAPPGSPVTSYYHGRSDAGGIRDFSGTVRPSGLIKKVRSCVFCHPYKPSLTCVDHYREGIRNGPPSRFLLSRRRHCARPITTSNQSA